MRYLVTGASGLLGRYLLREASRRGLAVRGWSQMHSGRLEDVPVYPVDLTEADAVATAFRAEPPDVVVHAGAVASVMAAHANPGYAQRVNADGTALLAELSARVGARLLFVSTDLVFDGAKGGYREEDAPAPLSVYGQSKAAAEQTVRATPRGLVARVSLLYGPSLSGRPSFFDGQVAALRGQGSATLFEDEWRTPLSLHTAAASLLSLCRADYADIIHLGGPERMSRLEMGRRLAAYLGVGEAGIVAARREDRPGPEPRPRDTSLDSSRWRGLFPGQFWPSYEEALGELFAAVSGRG